MNPSRCPHSSGGSSFERIGLRCRAAPPSRRARSRRHRSRARAPRTPRSAAALARAACSTASPVTSVPQLHMGAVVRRAVVGIDLGVGGARQRQTERLGRDQRHRLGCALPDLHQRHMNHHLAALRDRAPAPGRDCRCRRRPSPQTASPMPWPGARGPAIAHALGEPPRTLRRDHYRRRCRSAHRARRPSAGCARGTPADRR